MVTVEKVLIPSASFFEDNPCPDIKNIAYIHAGFECSPRITEDEKRYLGKGMIETMLPYKIQDNYDRAREMKAHTVIVLENNLVRAEIMPAYGGRLRRIYDKVQKRELLYVNPVFQPGNLALRNAWFSGGVEFNVGIKGHNPLTCSPMWARIDKTEDGDIVRLYEYERIRGVVYSMSFYLPDNSPVLYIQNEIENKNKQEINMYWWSNIAFPESERVRVITPTEESFVCTYLESRYYLDKCKSTDFLGVDATYPENINISRDFFYKIPENRHKWISAVHRDGYGLVQCSTQLMKGRKTFVWGQGQGGRNWNEWLSVDGSAYIEIQAGLAHTQLEHIPMPANTTWKWCEAYFPICSTGEKMHGDYKSAIDTVEDVIKSTVGNPDNLTFPCGRVLDSQIVFQGSDWGYLEEKLRGERISDDFEFPNTASSEVALWDTLLDEKRFDTQGKNASPISYVTDKRLLAALRALEEQTWYSRLHIGVIEYAGGNIKAAEEAWNASMALSANCWAVRNLAMLYKNEYHQMERAVEAILRAYELNKTSRTILIECAEILTATGNDERWLAIEKTLAPTEKNIARLRLLTAVALINVGQLARATEIVNPSFLMSDIKEGELSVSHIWFRLYRAIYAQEQNIVGRELTDKEIALADKKYPLPKKLDFRMH